MAENHASENPSARIVKTELFDPNVMAELLKAVKQFPKKTLEKLSLYNRKRRSGNDVMVVYKLGKNCDKAQAGRLFPEEEMGLANFPYDIRNPLLAPFYWDIDIENAHYTFLLKFGKEWGVKTDAIEYYINNREECLEATNADRGIAKVAFLRVAYGSVSVVNEICGTNHKEDDVEFVNDVDDEHIFKRIQKEISTLTEICYAKHPQFHFAAKGKKNGKASVFAVFLQTEERKCLLAMDCFMASKNRSLDVLIHDGGCVRKLENETAFPEELLRGGEQAIFEATGHKVKLVNKPIKHNFVMPNEADKVLPNGMKESVFLKMREEFEKKHFFLMENTSVCIENEKGGPTMLKSGDAATAFADSWGVDIEVAGQPLKRAAFLPNWLSRPGRRNISKLVFKPANDCGEDEYNLFKGFAGSNASNELNEQGLKRWLEVLNNSVGSIPERFNYAVGWFAQLIQNPADRHEQAFISSGVNGAMGVGKDLMFDFFGNKVLGPRYYYVAKSIDEVLEKHSKALEGTLLLKLEEASGFANRKNANMLKSLISQKSTNINPKGLATYTIDVFARVAMTTNEQTPVKMEEGDRRFFLNYAGMKNKGNFSYWKETAELFEDPATAKAVFEYLKAYDLSSYNIREIPRDDADKVLMETEKPYELQFLEWLAHKNENETSLKASSDGLYRQYSTFCEEHQKTPHPINHFGRCLAPYIRQQSIEKKKTKTSNIYVINLSVFRSETNNYETVEEDDFENPL